MNKTEMERIWARRGINQPAHLCLWEQSWRANGEWRARQGTRRDTKPGASNLKRAGRDFPPWSKSQPRDIEPSAELKARYKKDCPSNHKTLIAAFGQTRTKYDAPTWAGVPLFAKIFQPCESLAKIFQPCESP